MDLEKKKLLYKELENIQAKIYRCYDKENRDINTIDVEKDRNNIPKEYYDLIKEQVETAKNAVLPTRYETYSFYEIINDIVTQMDKDDVKNELKKIGEINDDALLFPIWGTCVMPGISANLLTSKRDARFIVLSEDIFIIANLLSKIVDQITFPLDTDGMLDLNFLFNDIEEYVNEKQDVQQRFNDLLGSIILAENPALAKQYYVPKSMFFDTILHSFETFIIAHEYAHCICNHSYELSKEGGSLERLMKKIGYDNRLVIHKTGDEYKADYIGAYITLFLHANSKFSKEVRFIGIYLAIKAMELMDRLEYMKSGVKISTETHPPAPERNTALIKAFFKNSNTEILEGLDKTIEVMFKCFVKNFANIALTNPDKIDIDAMKVRISFKEYQDYLYQ